MVEAESPSGSVRDNSKEPAARSEVGSRPAAVEDLTFMEMPNAFTDLGHAN